MAHQCGSLCTTAPNHAYSVHYSAVAKVFSVALVLRDEDTKGAFVTVTFLMYRLTKSNKPELCRIFKSNYHYYNDSHAAGIDTRDILHRSGLVEGQGLCTLYHAALLA